MALRPRTDPHIPGRSQPAHCHREKGDKKCGKVAHNWINLTINLLGKEIPVKKPVCDDCIQELKEKP